MEKAKELWYEEQHNEPKNWRKKSANIVAIHSSITLSLNL